MSQDFLKSNRKLSPRLSNLIGLISVVLIAGESVICAQAPKPVKSDEIINVKLR